VLNLVLDAALLRPMGLVGVALSTSACAAAGAALLYRALGQRLTRPQAIPERVCSMKAVLAERQVSGP
jgi:peptidoglycan biosynthesis protein MviN/MurJ (putative lipid II flippase)